MTKFFQSMGLAIVLALPSLSGVSPTGDQLQTESWKTTGVEIVSLVRDRFFDKGRADLWLKENARYAEDARDYHGFVEATKKALRRLEASHTNYFTPEDPGYYGLLSIFCEPLNLEVVETESIGVDLTPGNHIRVVFAGSPAEKAGIRRGDQILRADGVEFHPVLSFQGRSGRSVMLVVQSQRDRPPQEVVVVPRKIEPRREWLEAQVKGAKVVTLGAKKIAYMPFFSAAGEAHQKALREEIAGSFADADALVLDFRNGWGGANPTFLNLFDRMPPVLEQVDRDGARRRYDPQWRKPLVILINGGSTSGKEVVAYAIQKRKIGTLVGEKSAGAVVAGSPFRLQDGSLLYLAVADVIVDGERLEGRGVTPDVEVADDLPFAEGRDPQLAKALEVAGS